MTISGALGSKRKQLPDHEQDTLVGASTFAPVDAGIPLRGVTVQGYSGQLRPVHTTGIAVERGWVVETTRNTMTPGELI